MKSLTRVTLIFVLILAILIIAFPASAKTTKTEVTGKLYSTTSGPLKEWMTGNIDGGSFVNHGRDEPYVFTFETDYPGMNGWGYGSMNFEQHWGENWFLEKVHFWGPVVVSADEAGEDVLWQCTMNAFIGLDWVFQSDWNCHGKGINQGLAAKFSATADLLGGEAYMTIFGYIQPTEK